MASEQQQTQQSQMASNGGGQGTPGANGTFYAYEVPSMAPGDYEIKIRQTVGATDEKDQILETTQKLRVKSVSPYVLPPELVHSYYPPRLGSVDPKTLPHLLLKGAVPWERPVPDATIPVGSAPAPWLALLVFSPDELSVPAEVAGVGVKPSGTMAVSLPIATVNGLQASRFCLRSPFLVDKYGSVNDLANFIFVKGSVLRSYLESQEPPADSQPQRSADLQRYRYLVHITDTGMDSGDGHSKIKFSTVLGHRVRPVTEDAQPRIVHAHLVSLEGVTSRIDWETLASAPDAAAVPLVSLFSWTYQWLPYQAKDPLVMFEHLVDQVRPLMVPFPERKKDTTTPDLTLTPAGDWVRARLKDGYTIVRHRDIAGEGSMALYRGPLTPGHARRLPLRPSMNGTDLQVMDMAAGILDISYSVAWDLGRSLAGRDSRFTAAMAMLRRQLTAYAAAQVRMDEYAADTSIDVAARASDIVKSTLTRLEALFGASPASLSNKLHGSPRPGEPRWQMPASALVPAASAPGVMTQAKLRRGLRKHARAWLATARRQLCAPDPPAGQHLTCDIPALQTVIDWLVANLLSLRLVPASYLFPDPSVIQAETISSCVVDDAWVDALVDGALSLANTVGGADDPVRDEIRRAINAYLREAPVARVPIATAGFVLRSSVVEAFPDLHITAALDPKGPEDSLPVVLQTKHDDTILCLWPRGPAQHVVDFTVTLKLPPHQQRFGLENVGPDKLTFGFELRYFKNPRRPASEKETPHEVTWQRGLDGAATSTATEAAPGAFLHWPTGVLAPHVVAATTARVAEHFLGAAFAPLGSESQSVYLAIQLAARDHALQVPFHLSSAPDAGLPRQLFPAADPAADADRDDAVLHDPQALPVLPPPSLPTSTPETPQRSWLTKKVFSLQYPGASLPARSDPPTQLVFAVKPSPGATAAGVTLALVALDLSIPVGEDLTDLLDAEAPMPTPKTTDARKAWMAAVMRPTPTELVVQLRPRRRGTANAAAAVPFAGVDPSFVLLGATINGVGGDGVVLRSREVYHRTETLGGKTVQTDYEVRDHWVVTKE